MYMYIKVRENTIHVHVHVCVQTHQSQSSGDSSIKAHSLHQQILDKSDNDMITVEREEKEAKLYGNHCLARITIVAIHSTIGTCTLSHLIEDHLLRDTPCRPRGDSNNRRHLSLVTSY